MAVPKRNPFRQIWNDYRANCRRKGISFELSPEELQDICSRPCLYCEADPSNNRHGQIYSGIDRKDNSKGYTPKNCVPSCHRCNSVKGDKLTFDQMRAIGGVLRVLRIAANEKTPRGTPRRAKRKKRAVI